MENNVPTDLAQPTHRLRRMIGCATVLGLAGLGGAQLGANVGTESPTHTTIGDHAATIRLNEDSDSTTAYLHMADLRLPKTVDVTGQTMGIDIHLSNLNVLKNENYSSVVKYLKFLEKVFDNLDHELGNVSSDVEHHVVNDTRNGALIGLGIGGLLVGAELVMSRRRRSDKETPIINKLGVVASIALFTTISGAFLSSSTPNNSPHTTPIHANPNFKGTALEGSQLVNTGTALSKKAVPLIEKFVSESKDKKSKHTKHESKKPSNNNTAAKTAALVVHNR